MAKNIDSRDIERLEWELEARTRAMMRLAHVELASLGYDGTEMRTVLAKVVCDRVWELNWQDHQHKMDQPRMLRKILRAVTPPVPEVTP